MARDCFNIAARPGGPVDIDQWGWRCGFYPPLHRCRQIEGTAAMFDQARADFDVAWRAYLPKCTESDFDGYRRQRAWTAWKYGMHDAGLPLPAQLPDLRSRCFCGAPIDASTMDRHVFAAHMAATIGG